MNVLTFGVKDILQNHKISGYRLAKETGMTPKAIYNLLDEDNPPQRIEIRTLETLISTLSDLTGNQIQVQDLLVYKQPTLN